MSRQQESKTKFFTFDSNGSFHSSTNNTGSPARSKQSVIATDFLRKSLGKQRYAAITKLIGDCEDPKALLDFGQVLSHRQRQVMHLLKGDR